MSSSNTPLSNNALTPLQRVSLNSAITNVILDSDSGNSSLVIRTGTANSLYIDKNSNVGINTNSPSAQLEVASATGACLRLRYGSSTTAFSDIFTSSSGNLNITANGGTVNIDSPVNITGALTLSGSLTLSGGGSLASSLGVIDANSAGVAVAGKALVVDSNRSITNINNIGVSTITMGSSTITTADASRISGLTAGTAGFGKAMVLDSLGSISGITTLSATSLVGVIQTPTQPNIQLLGTLSSLNVSGSTILSSSADAVSTTNGGALTIAGGLAVGKNVYIGGNLYVNGSTTAVNSSTINIADNTLLLNASPSGPNDSGMLIQRYQPSNDNGLGNVLTDTPAITTTITAATTLTITLSSGSNVNDYYAGWWILANNQSRRVASYNGSSRVLTLESVFTITPSVGGTVQMYNRSYAGIIWNEATKTFQSIYTAYDHSNTLSIIDEAPLRVGLFSSGSAAITSPTDSSSSLTGALQVVGGVGIAKNLYVGTGIYGTIRTAAQPQITSLGALSSLTITDANTSSLAQLTLNGTLAGAIGITGSAYITNPSTFFIEYNGAHRLLIDSNGNIAIGTSAFGYKLNVGGSVNVSSISISGSSVATTLITGTITAGIASAGKVLSVDSSLNVSGINTIATTTGLIIGSTSFGATELGYLTGLSVGSATTGKVLIPDSNKSISGLTSIVLNNPSPSGIVSQSFTSDTQSFVSGVQGSGTSISANSYYWHYNGAYRLFMNTSGNVAIGHGTVDGNTFDYKLNVNGSINATTYYLNGILVNLDLIQGPTPGTASASRALIVDSARNITNINSLGATKITIGGNELTSTESGYLTGITAGTASAGKALIVDASNNISGIGQISVSSLLVGGQTVMTSGSGSFVYIQNITEGIAGASKALVVDSNKEIIGIHKVGILDATTTGAAVLQISSDSNTLSIGARGSAHSSGADLVYWNYGGSDRLLMNTSGNIAIGTTSIATYKLNVNGSLNATSYYLNGTLLAFDNLSYLSGSTAGTALSNKALILDSSSNIAGINSLTSDKLVASTSLKIGSNTITYEAGYLAGATQGTATNGKALILDTVGSITGINNIGATSITLGSSSITETTAGYISGLSLVGTAQASKVLTTDSNNNVSGINNISAQSVTINGALLSSSLFDAINGVTAGQLSPNKAMIFDSTSSLYFGTSKLSFANSMFTLTTTQTSNTDYTIFQRWINDTTTDVIADVSVSNLACRIGTYSNHALRLMTNNSTKIYIDTLGNVGIGDISPEYRLDVAGTTRSGQLSTFTPTSSTLSASSVASSYGLVLGTSSATSGTQNQSAIAFINTATSFATATPNAAIMLERPSGSSSAGSLLFFTKESTSGTATIVERMRISAAGNVGIGTISPSYKIDVVGDSRIQGDLYIGVGTFSSLYHLDVVGDSRIQGDLFIGSGASPNIIRFTGTAGDATTAHTVIAERIYANTEDSELLLFKGNDSTDRIRLRAPSISFQIANETYSTLANDNEVLTVSNTRRVGIGTTNPECSLHIKSSGGSGWVSIQRSEWGSSVIDYQVETSTGDALIGTNSNDSFSLMTNNTRRLYISAGGNVGIGTTSPSYKLDVVGNVAADTAYLDYLSVGTTSTVSGYRTFLTGAVRITGGATVTPTDDYGYLNSSGAGRVTSGFSSILTALYVSAGRIVCADEIDSLSDYRIKKEVQPLDIAFVKQFLKETTPVKYKYSNRPDTDIFTYGFIAQELVKKDYPDLYRLEPNDEAEEIIEEDGFVNPKGALFSICYNSIIPMLSLAQKDTYNEVDELKAKVASLEERLAKLESLLENK